MPDTFFERLTQLDHSFLVYEGPSAPMHVGSTLLFEAGPLCRPDGGIDFDRIVDYVGSRLHAIPRYRQRLAWTPLARHPVWVDDDRFNLLYHLRHSRLPHPGDERQLKRMAGRIVSQHLDRGKPLWELWLIEGVENDRFALVAKTHHCMIDGVSGVDLLSVLLTAEPTHEVEPALPWEPRPAPSTFAFGRDEAWRALGAPLATGGALLDVALDREGARGRFGERIEALARLASTGLTNASPTPINQPIGPYRRIDWLPMDLRAVKRVAKALGGTVNDVVLAVATGGVRRFLRKHRQEDVNGLDFRVMAPVSMRGESERGALGNRVAAWIVPLPVAESDPIARFQRIREVTAELKRTKAALGADTLAQATEWTGSILLSLGSRLMNVGQPFNLVVTNVPGPRVALHLLGARMLEAHPMVPLLGQLSTGIALFSYRDVLSWGFTADWDLVPDLHDFVLSIDRAFRRLADAAGETL
jgi:WS/DGAT/MGAT family acyltransferase